MEIANNTAPIESIEDLTTSFTYPDIIPGLEDEISGETLGEILKNKTDNQSVEILNTDKRIADNKNKIINDTFDAIQGNTNINTSAKKLGYLQKRLKIGLPLIQVTLDNVSDDTKVIDYLENPTKEITNEHIKNLNKNLKTRIKPTELLHIFLNTVVKNISTLPQNQIKIHHNEIQTKKINTLQISQSTNKFKKYKIDTTNVSSGNKQLANIINKILINDFTNNEKFITKMKTALNSTINNNPIDSKTYSDERTLIQKRGAGSLIDVINNAKLEGIYKKEYEDGKVYYKKINIID